MSEANRDGPTSLDERVDRVCDRFEAAWQAVIAGGLPPRLEDYLADTPEPGRSALLQELLGLEVAYRCRRGEAPAATEYRQRFPNHTEVIGAAFREEGLPANAGPAQESAAGPERNQLTTPEVPHPDAATEPAAAPVPAVSHYRGVRLHAQGGLGEVFVAVDEELQRTVALKRIKAEHAADAGSRRRFLREAEITALLEHPGVVPVHGLVRDAADQPHYVMRFVQGESLRDAIERYHAREPADPVERRLAFRKLLQQFIAVCNTVGYAHSRGVIHRDLKPGNVMLGKFGETLVADWGLAKVVGRTEATSTDVVRRTAPRPRRSMACPAPRPRLAPERCNGR